MSTNSPRDVPPEVYQRRRIFVAVGALAVLFLIAKVIVGILGGSSVDAQAAPNVSSSSTSAPLVTDAPTEVPSVMPSEDPLLSESQTPTAQSPVPDGYCSDSDISIKVVLDRKTTKVGTGLHLQMKVKNVSDKSCKRDLGSGANEVTIISGPALIWSTDHCNPSTAKDVVELAPGQTWSVNVVWTGKLSAKGCKILGMAKAGAYWGHARNGTLNSDGARFVIKK